MSKKLFQIVLLLNLISCKITEKDILGKYNLDYYPKTSIQINGDHTFEFIKVNRNPYLLPYDHPDENYFITKGAWSITTHDKIEITSTKDTIIYPLVDLRNPVQTDSKISHFVFYDAQRDTVKILYVQYPDGSLTGELHGSMGFYIEDLSKKDSLQFHFYGYRPWLFISGYKKNGDYSVYLKPEFRPRYFNNTQFAVKKNKLIDIQRHGKFRKTKNKI